MLLSQKILISTAGFNIDNNKKCFVCNKSAYHTVKKKVEQTSADFLVLSIFFYINLKQQSEKTQKSAEAGCLKRLVCSTGVMMLKIQFCITGINYILKYTTIKNVFLIVIIFHNSCFYCITHQINTALVSIWDFFQKHLNIKQTPNFWTVVNVYAYWEKKNSKCDIIQIICCMLNYVMSLHLYLY